MADLTSFRIWFLSTIFALIALVALSAGCGQSASPSSSTADSRQSPSPTTQAAEQKPTVLSSTVGEQQPVRPDPDRATGQLPNGGQAKPPIDGAQPSKPPPGSVPPARLPVSALGEPKEADLIFYPDSGIRMPDAANPGVSLSADGSVSLLYLDLSANPPTSKVATAKDGMTFGTGTAVRSADEFRAHKLPDGTYRAYVWDPRTAGLTSSSSKDGVNFTEDAGVRYSLHPSDNGLMGVYDFFNDSAGGVVMLYIGDMRGLNNVRRAYSKDNGVTFQFERGNVFGDETYGGGGRSFVDQKTLVLPDRRVRAFVMQQGTLYSLISVDDGKSFNLEPGVRLQASAFTGLGFVSLHDPQVIRLPDGRYRMYVTGMIGSGGAPGSGEKQVIVSATTRAG